MDILRNDGAQGPAWERSWTELRHARIVEADGWAVLRSRGLTHLKALATTLQAESLRINEPINLSALETFDETARLLQLSSRQVDELRSLVQRSLLIAQLQAGDLPKLRDTNLRLDVDEIVHLDVRCSSTRQMARGPQTVPGRLVATNKKFRFLSSGPGGWESSWKGIMAASQVRDQVVVETSLAKGSVIFSVDDAEYVAAVLTGVVGVFKRIVLAPGRRDSRTIPNWMKGEVHRRDGGQCVECGATESLEYDHVIPHSKGGATSVNNLQLLCRPCNSRKGDRI